MYEFVEVPVNAHELEEGLQKMKEAREKYDGDAQMDEEAFEVAVSTAKSREREYAEAAAENYAEAHGLSSEEKIEKLEAERIDIERKQERTRAEINAQREELARGMREMGVTQLPDVAEAETQQLEEDTAEAEKLEEEDDEESEGEGDSYAAAALGSARTDAAEEDDEDSLPTNPLQLGWEIDELEKTKEKVLPRSSRGALGEEEVDRGDTAKSARRRWTRPTGLRLRKSRCRRRGTERGAEIARARVHRGGGGSSLRRGQRPVRLSEESIEDLEKTKEKVLLARPAARGEEEVDEEAFEVAVESRVRGTEAAVAEATPRPTACLRLRKSRSRTSRRRSRIDAEIAEEKKDLVEHLHDEGVWEEPEPGRAETEKLEEETHEKEQALKERIAEEHAHWHPWDEVEVFEKAWDGKTGEEEATSDLGLDAAEEDDEDSLPTNPLQLGWEIDELEKTKEKVLPRSSRGALGEEEVDEEAFEVAVDTAKSRVREYTEAAAEAYAEANGLSSPSEESIEDLEAEAAELDAEHERIDAEIAEEKKDLVEHLHDEGVWEEPEPGRAETEKLEEETHEKEQALKERIAEEHAHWHPWDEVEVFEKAWDGKTGEEEATSDLGLDAAEEDDEDSLPTNPLQLGWEIDELEKTKEKVLPRSSRGALDFGTGPLSALEDILGASLDASDPETARPGRAARTTPRRGARPGATRGARALTRLAPAAAAAAVAASVPKESRFDEFRNAPGAIPGLLEHVLAHTASKAQLRASSNLGTEVGGSLASDLRLVTYANAAYWPLAKVLISSLAHNAPRALPSLTVMLTDPRDVAECDALSTRHGHSCFFDSDMIDTVLHGDASLANAEGSQLAGSDALSAEPSLGKALRVAWCWRKVHALYTLVEGGVPAVFLDASTAVLADPRPAVAARLADGATLVTLSDFGGAKEQEAINTGLVAARAGDGRAARLLEEWMAMEPRAEDTEQAYLTWELAPEARARGDRIVALPHAKFPSYVTFDKREHIRGSGSQGEARRESGDERGSKRDAPDAALGGERRDELEIADGAGGIAVHAAYCGSVESKLAFLRRVDAMRRAPGKLHPVDPAETAPGGCDAYDRRKFFQCGHAPWDGDC